jgi:hypothetical protein
VIRGQPRANIPDLPNVRHVSFYRWLNNYFVHHSYQLGVCVQRSRFHKTVIYIATGINRLYRFMRLIDAILWPFYTSCRATRYLMRVNSAAPDDTLRIIDQDSA